MSFQSFISNSIARAAESSRVNRLQGELGKLRSTNVQLMKDVLSMSESAPAVYRGNKYQTYEAQVTEIDKKYNGTADWGVFQTGSIIDLRAVFIIAEGIKIMPTVKPEEAQKELEWARAFISFNNLDEEIAHEFAKEAEIEGKILLKVAWEEKEKMVSARFIPWTQKKYKIEAAPNDYLRYEKAFWTPQAAQEQEILLAPQFVYKKFGGRAFDPNSAAPKISRCLTQIEFLDQALRDYREINRLFAGPLLVFFFDDMNSAKLAQDDIDRMNFRIKKALSTSARDIRYIQPDAGGLAALENEIITNAKFISGCSGVPVHFLGLPDLLSNRATADNLMELVYSTTLKERTTWIGAYEELITKAIGLYNQKMGLSQLSEEKKLDATKLQVEIPFISPQTWTQLEKVFIPLALAGKVSDALMLSKIPGVNVEEEMARQSAANEPEGAEHEDIIGKESELEEEAAAQA
jgi:hypothetical protein